MKVKKRLAMIAIAIVLWVIGANWWMGSHFNYAVPVTFLVSVLCLYAIATRWNVFELSSTRILMSMFYVGFLFLPVAAAILLIRGPTLMYGVHNYTEPYGGAIVFSGVVLCIIGAWALSMILAIRVWKEEA